MRRGKAAWPAALLPLSARAAPASPVYAVPLTRARSHASTGAANRQRGHFEGPYARYRRRFVMARFISLTAADRSLLTVCSQRRITIQLPTEVARFATHREPGSCPVSPTRRDCSLAVANNDRGSRAKNTHPQTPLYAAAGIGALRFNLFVEAERPRLLLTRCPVLDIALPVADSYVISSIAIGQIVPWTVTGSSLPRRNGRL
jgi:hypothetical protein